MPAARVLDLIQDELAGSKGIVGLEHHGGRHGADEALPHGLVGKVVRELLRRVSRPLRQTRHRPMEGTYLETEQDSADGGSKGDRDSRRSRRRQHLSFSSYETRESVPSLPKCFGAAMHYSPSLPLMFVNNL